MKILPFALLLPLCACGGHEDHHPAPPVLSPRPVSVLVEVYDPVTNFVWENVSVRVVEVRHEWSGCTCTNAYVDWYLTDAAGRVFFDEYFLAASGVGFLEDGAGRAVLHPDLWEDEATVVLEVDAVGFTPVIVEVPLQWDVPDVFVEIPFS